jgi:hypothetical protein
VTPDTVKSRTFEVSDQEAARLPVRSALFKQRTGGLVVGWVITSEYSPLYGFVIDLRLQYMNKSGHRYLKSARL